MIKIDDNALVDLDKLAKSHYESLIAPILLDGINYHATSSLIQRIRIQKNLDAFLLDQRRFIFWNYLLDNSFTNLKRIIVSRPNILKNMIDEIEIICGVGFFSNDIDYGNATLTEFGGVVKKIFNYSLYRGKQECEDNCAQFNLSLCPYCNVQVIQVISRINGLTGSPERLALLQLDHFYPQSRHPYLSVSFFNMVPGCSQCNAQLKLEKKFDIDSHFNPFHKRFDDYFEFKLRNIILSDQSDVEFNISNKLPYLDNAIVDFEIISRYSNNVPKRAIFRLVKAFKCQSPKIINSLSQQLIGLFINNESKRRVMLNNQNVPINQNEINEVHLGKLKRDIAIQFGMFDDI
jgi:hypothetical protein